MRLDRFINHGQRTMPMSGEYVPIGVQMTGAPALWENGITGEGKIAALIDTGCDISHPDLASRIIDYIDLTGEGKQDDLGHGTHVAGTICACGRIRGVAPGARLLVIKVLGKSGSCEDSLVAKAIRLAVDWRGPHGERVSAINISLGSDIDAADVHDAIKYAVANNIEPVCAAGNNGDGQANTPELTYPGAYQESVEVGAIGYDSKPAPFSNTNGTMDLCAVGVYVDSCWPGNLGGPFASLSGTSMATPHITGLLMLEEQMFERINGRPFRDEDERWAFACANVKPLPDLPREVQGMGLGYGRAELLGVKKSMRVYVSASHQLNNLGTAASFGGSVGYCEGYAMQQYALACAKALNCEVQIPGHDDDLATICRKSNAFKADLFVEWHSNACADPTVKGTDIYILAKGGRAEKFAKMLQKRLGGTIKTANFQVLKDTVAPAVLIELTYHTNPGEVLRLMDPGTVTAVAKRFAEAVEEYRQAQ